MKNFLFLLCALFFGLSAHSQDTENVSFQKVVSFRGSFTTAERDLLDVPVGDVWMIYNSTTAILEYAREDDVWGAVGGGAADNLGANADRSLFTVSGAGTIATLNLNTIDSTHIKNGSIESNDFADNSITTAKILNGTIVGVDIANDAILTGKIADGTILPADLDAVNAPVVGYHLALDASNQFVWVTPTAGSVAALADLSDVSSAVQGAGNVLVSNGTTFASRQLIEADISDLQHTINTDNQNARQVAVLDAGARFDSINVEGVLEELYDKWVVGNDDQVLTFVSPNLSIENGNSVDLSAINTDAQTLSFVLPNLSITGGNSVDLSALQDGTGTDDQTAAEVPVTTTNFNGHLSAADTNVQLALETLDDLVAGGSQTLSTTGAAGNISISGGNTIVLNVDDADANATNEIQDLSLTGNSLSLTGDASPVDLAPYLDNTDAQTLSFTSPNLSISGGNSVDLSAIDTNTQRTDEEIQDVAGAMATGNTETLITVTYQDADGTMDYVVNSDLSLYNNTTSNFSTGAHTVDTDDQTAAEVPSTPSGNLAATNVQDALNELQTDVDTRSVGAHTVNTDNQTLTFTSPNLSISGGTSVNLSAIDTNTQRTDEEIQDVVGAMVTTTNTETLITVTYQDATNDIDFVVNSDLSLYNNATSNFSTGAHTVNTDNQTLSIATNDLSISGGNSVSLAPYLDNTDDQTAAEVPYTNTTSGLAATQVQAALDEIEARVDVNDAKVSGIQNVSEDTTPELGGDLYVGTNQINSLVSMQFQVDVDNNNSSLFGFRNGSGSTVLTIDETGGLNLNGSAADDAHIYINPTDVVPSPSEGTFYADDSENRLKYHDGTSFKAFLLAGDVTDPSGNYLPLTGGTLTGTTTINNDNGFVAPYFRSVTGGGTAHSTANATNWDTEDHTAPTYSFWTASNTTGSTGFPNTTGQAFFVKGATDARSFAFWKTGTDNDPDGLYSGYTNAGVWVWNEMWTSGSDGAGSGLDADLYQGNDISASGNRWGVMAPVATDGVTEVGYVIDFHLTDGDTSDNGGRLQIISSGQTARYLSPSGQTTAQVEAYAGSLDYSRIGANGSGGYLQLSDGAGGSQTTIRGYSTSDFYGGNLVVHNGSVTASNFILSSDKRLKRRVRDYKVQPLDIKWKSYFMNDDPMHLRYGVVAQDLQKDHPEFIREDENGMLSVAYIDLLVAKNAELEARVEKLEALVEQLIKEKK